MVSIAGGSRLLAVAVAILPFSVNPVSADEGKDAFMVCQSCHRIGDDAIHISGPQLNGVIGRKAGSIEGFHFSKGMTTAGEGGLVWTAETLDAFLAKPQDFVKGTRMPFRGVPEPEKRKLIIAYMESFSQARSLDAAAAAGPCAATAKTAAGLAADKDYGEYLAGECVTCHQESGHADGIPAITGLPREVFVKALCEYKTKHREHPVMNMVTGNLGDPEFAALAAFFASLE
ncbi:MAG: cytochrome C [Phyllobacteriaceae bacterium]|nr:cytochrome C [Phyllobacteriaceae bacterium]